MTEQETREIIRQEIQPLLEFFKNTNYNFQKHLTILDDKNIQVGRTNGCIFGTATDQKIGFLGKTPVVRQATITDPSGGTTVDTQSRTAINAIIDVLQSFGFIA